MSDTATLGAAPDAVDTAPETSEATVAPARVAVETFAAPTRPAVAPRRARRPQQRKVTRFTLDLEAEQHRFLRLWSLSQGVEASKVCRVLLYLLEADESLQDRVYNELFADDDE